VRLYRANAGPLTAVAAIATAVTLLATFARAGVSLSSLSGPSFGLTLFRGSGGSHIGLDARILAYGLVGLLGGAWAAATIVPLLLRHVRERRSARYAELGAGLPFVAWVTVAALIIALLEVVLRVLLFFGLPEALGPLPLELVVELLLATAVLFYVPLIVDGDDGLSALLASWRLVRRTGFWRLLVYLLVADVAVMLSANIAILVAELLPGDAVLVAVQLFLGLIVVPLMTTFTTVLYLLATGARAPLLAATVTSEDQRRRGSVA
jgi:hypothetical protein